MEDLEERDTLYFPSPYSVPVNNSVIPSYILDDFLDAPDEIAMSGVIEVFYTRGIRLLVGHRGWLLAVLLPLYGETSYVQSSLVGFLSLEIRRSMP